MSVVDGIWQFSWDYFRNLIDKPGAYEEDILFSPISIVAALSMVLIGAKAKTFEELLKILYFTALARDNFKSNDLLNSEMHMQIGNVLKTATSSDLTKMADRIYLDEKFKIPNSVLSLAHSAYNSDIMRVSFKNEANTAEDEINKWVSVQTDGMIPDLLSNSVTSDTLMVLINAIYFKGNWETQFDPADTTNTTFYGLSSSTTVPMMYMENKMRYVSNTGSDIPPYQAVALPFANSIDSNSMLSLAVILPEDIKKFSEAIVSQTNEGPLKNGLWLSNVLSSLFKEDLQKVIFKLPKFKMAPHGGSIKSVLEKLGLQKAFSKQADFSGFNDVEQVFITDVIHKAIMEVDEKGAKAAAATAVITGKMSLIISQPETVPTVVVNKPAYVLIVESKTNVPLFFGLLAHPQPF